MYIFQKVSLILAATAVSACTTLGQYQAQCEARTKLFPELAECIKAEIASSDSRRMQNNAGVRLYLLTAEQLSDRVRKGAISDLDARVELQKLYVELRSKEESAASARAAVAAANRAAAAANQPRTATCTQFGNFVNCTSN